MKTVKKKYFIKIIICFSFAICLFFLSFKDIDILHTYAIQERNGVSVEAKSLGDVSDTALLNGNKKSDDVVLIEGLNNLVEPMQTAERSELTGVKYIPNANYFLINPKHCKPNKSDNAFGTCTTVAVQLLLGYHNYYSDRRIIPASFLAENYGDLNAHPFFYRFIEEEQGCPKIGTGNGVYEEIFNRTPLSDVILIGQAFPLVVKGTYNFLNAYAEDNVVAGINITSDFFSAEEARADIDAGRPIVLGMNLLFEANMHVVIAYGYATLEGVDGFLVHYGWGDTATLVWVPESVFGFQIRMETNHVHNLTDSGRSVRSFMRELSCDRCGYKTLDMLYNTTGSTITGVNYPITQKILTIPENISDYSIGTATHSTKIISSIGSNVFENQTRISEIRVPDTITRIENNAFKDCVNLNTITMGSGVRYIAQNAFDNTGIWNNAPNNSIVYADTWCLGYKGEITHATLRAGTVGIVDGAFANNSNLSSVSLPTSLQYIGEEAFTNPYREGYVFEGWFTNETFEGDSYTSAELVAGENITYYAKLTEIATYTIEYVDEDNQILDTRLWRLPTEHTYGTQTVLKDASREGYSFEGWYIRNDETEVRITAIPAFGYNHNITLYAKWEVETYSITYQNVMNEYMEMNPPLSHTYGIDTPLYPAEMEGYTFAGWSTNSEHEGPLLSCLSAYAYTEDITLYPVWICNNGMCEVYYVNYLLVTDCSDENYRENYFKEYEFTDVLEVAPWSNLSEIESYVTSANYAGILFFATTQELMEELVGYIFSDTMFDIPVVVATTVLNESGSMQTVTFMRDYYSAGYNIASTYVDSLTENNVEIMEIVQAVYEEYGYFPVIADDDVKYNTMLLLGLSDVFGVPVKFFGEGEIMNIVAGENSFNQLEHLLFIEPTNDILDLFDGIWNLSACYFFGYDEASIAQCLLVSEHVYAIRERVRYLCEIIENFEDGIVLDEDDYYSWTFDTISKWGALGYTMEDSSVQDGYINYWRELGYTIDENGWNHYKNYVWIGNTGEGSEYDYNNIYYLEMGMVLLEI